MSILGSVGFTGAGGTDSAGYAYSILVQLGDEDTFPSDGFPIWISGPVCKALEANNTPYELVSNGIIVNGTLFKGGSIEPYKYSNDPAACKDWYNAHKDQYGGAYYVDETNHVILYATADAYQVVTW